MDKADIEQKDIEVIKKLNTVRQKNVTIKKKKLLKNSFTTFTFLVLVCFTPLLLFSYNNRKTDKNIQHEPNRKSKASTNQSQKDSSLQQGNENQPFTANLEPFDTNAPGRNNDQLGKKTNLSSQVTTDALDLSLAKTVVCSDVNNRKPIGEQNVFSLKKNKFSYVWTDVRAKSYPNKIIHTYYLNGEKYCEVPLTVKYSRMRTWSKITLIDDRHVGSWKVEITDKTGTILKQIEFEVNS